MERRTERQDCTLGLNRGALYNGYKALDLQHYYKCVLTLYVFYNVYNR